MRENSDNTKSDLSLSISACFQSVTALAGVQGVLNSSRRQSGEVFRKLQEICLLTVFQVKEAKCSKRGSGMKIVPNAILWPRGLPDEEKDGVDCNFQRETNIVDVHLCHRHLEELP